MRKIIELVKGKLRYCVTADEIICVNSDEHYIHIILRNQKEPIILHRGIGAMQIELAQDNLHVRIHERHLVNFTDVLCYGGGFVYFKPPGIKPLPLSEPGAGRLKARIEEHNGQQAVLAAREHLAPRAPVRHTPR